MNALPVFGPVPARVLCQTPDAGCASCCGTYNFVDRHQPSWTARMQRRTDKVDAANWDVTRLAAVRDTLLADEAPHRLTDVILSCPFAGFVRPEALGCLIHPARHPAGEDLRDLAVHPREVCEGHFCAPHQWLTEREKDFAARCRSTLYGTLVTDAGLCKALVATIDEAASRPAQFAGPDQAQPALDALFAHLLDWPHRDPDPRRFGAYVLDERADERRVDDPLAAVGVEAGRHPSTIVGALSSRFSDADEALTALRSTEHLCRAVAAALETTC